MFLTKTQRLFILICLISVALMATGCSNDSEEWVEVFKMMKEDCNGTLSYTISRSEWNTQISMTCVEDTSHE